MVSSREKKRELGQVARIFDQLGILRGNYYETEDLVGWFVYLVLLLTI